MPRYIDPEIAAQKMRSAGVEPLVPYPGAHTGWKSRCLTCGEIGAPWYDSVVNRGLGGCNSCAKKASQDAVRDRNLESAVQMLREHGFEMVDSYTNARTKMRLRCLDCGTEIVDATTYIKAGRQCVCKKRPRKPLSVFEPELSKELHPTKNGQLTAELIGTGYTKNVWWLCPNGHEYESTPANRIAQRSGCLYCQKRIAIPGETDLFTEQPDLARQLVIPQPNGVDPNRIRPSSNIKLLWRCPENSNHLWFANPNDRIRGNGCPFCKNKFAVSGETDFATLYPDLAKQWHPTLNESLEPHSLLPKSNKSVWWVCSKNPEHVWKASVATRTSGSGCGKCVLFEPGRNDIETLAPNLVAEWDFKKNKELPSQVGVSSRNRFWWICPEGHSFDAAPVNRFFNGTNCKFCSSGGFNSSKPGIVYFIEHQAFGAQKVGITNGTSKQRDRLAEFQRDGWSINKTWAHDDGRVIQNVETMILRWIRVENKLPPFLAPEDMLKTGGASETFSGDAIPAIQIIERIDAEFIEQIRLRNDFLARFGD